MTRATDPWLCLMYHDIEETAPSAGAASYFAVSRRAFAQQLALIADTGHAGCSLAGALAREGPRVAITFDDGNEGQVTRAFPELARRGMTATFFVTTGWVGRPGYASWDALREMKAAGMSIQSHTHAHPFLSELEPAAVRDELTRSKGLLDEELGQATDTLALPNGDGPRPDARHLLGEAGYATVATSRWGVNRGGGTPDGSPLFVQRCTVRGEPSAPDFQLVLARDPGLFLRRRARESVLGALRRALGPTRYSRWRRMVLGGVTPEA